jgi:hypothetical protein
VKVKIKEEFNVFELFIHENEAMKSICPYALADAINEHLIDVGYKVCPPESLERFTLFNADDEEEGYIDRYYTVQQVKDVFPTEVVEALEGLNETEIDLSPGAS